MLVVFWPARRQPATARLQLSLPHPGFLCKVQDASVEQVVEQPRDREDATNDCAQRHKEVRQLLSRLRVKHGSETAFPQAFRCNLMWAYQPRSTRQSANLCAKEPLHIPASGVRPCDGVWHLSHHVVVSDNQLFLTSLSPGQAAGLHGDERESPIMRL